MIDVKPPLRLDRAVRAAAARIQEAQTPLLDARVLAKHAWQLDDAALILAGERVLTQDEASRFDAFVARRAAGESVAHIVGEKEFYGLIFKLAPGVLAPRPDSETLIDAAKGRRNRSAPLRILDLGTGSGCLLCAFLSVFPNATGVGVDINESALGVARANATALGFKARADFFVRNWTAALPGRFDIIVANPPYIRGGDREVLAPEIRDFEDPRALFGGDDGLDAFRSILAGAPGRISPSGLMIIELGVGQDEAAKGLASSAFPGAAIDVQPDLGGRPRALVIDLSQQKSL